MILDKLKNIKCILILGDSKCVIDLLTDNAMLDVLNLVVLKHRIEETKNHF